MNNIGPYKMLRKLGEGGMGVVYEAEDTILHRHVAVKLIHQHLISDESLSTRFLSEARLTASLLHPNIATLYNLIEHENQLAMVMEYVDGITLDALLERHKPLEQDLAAGILVQVLAALEYAHEHHIVHRDIKPSNIMISKSGVVKIMDFGIAHRTGTSRLTQTGKMVGTLHYMAPEQILGQEAGAQSDLYACGIVLYEMLTGDPPFAGKSDFTLMEAQIKTAPSLRYPTLNTSVSRVLSRVLRKKSEQRFSSAAEFAEAIRSGSSPYTATRIRQTVFETAPEQRQGPISADRTPKTTTNPGAVVAERITSMPSWIPKAIFGVAVVVLVLAAFTFFKPDRGPETSPIGEDATTSEMGSFPEAQGAPLNGRFESLTQSPGPIQGQDQDQVENYLSKARELFNQGKYLPPGDNALYYCNEILKIDPRHREALQLRQQIYEKFKHAGDQAMKQKQYADALEHYEFALMAVPDDPEVLQKLKEARKLLQSSNSIAAKKQTPASTSPKRNTNNSPPPSPSSKESGDLRQDNNSRTTDPQEAKPSGVQSPPPPQEEVAKVSEPAERNHEVEVPKNTKLIVALSERVSSEHVREGQRISFTCPMGMTVNGIRVIAPGTTATGTITNLRPSEGTRSAKLEITMDQTVSISGEHVPLYGVFMQIAKGKEPVTYSSGSRFEVAIGSTVLLHGIK